MSLPKCYFDMITDGDSMDRIAMEFRSDIVPRTAENFRAPCTDEKGFKYKGSQFHCIIPNFMCHGGDITNNDRSGGKSIYGDTFKDQNFTLDHLRLTMNNRGRNTNSSQFYITFVKTPWLDGKLIAFGEVVRGFDVVEDIESYGHSSGNPSKKIVIRDCGVL